MLTAVRDARLNQGTWLKLGARRKPPNSVESVGAVSAISGTGYSGIKATTDIDAEAPSLNNNGYYYQYSVTHEFQQHVIGL